MQYARKAQDLVGEFMDQDMEERGQKFHERYPLLENPDEFEHHLTAP